MTFSRILLGLCLLLTTQAFAQLNTTLIGNFQYDQQVSDVWGYVAPDGTEYALVGLQNGVSVVSLADPANPVESGQLSGAASNWRDLKTYGEYAYVTNETAGGLLVVDLTQLPDTVTATNWTPSITEGLNAPRLSTCHNIYIDENGVAYLAGCNLNGGGMIFVDVATTPGSPKLIDVGDARYSHDVFVRDNVMYSSDINDGFFSITDVSDKEDVVLMATQTTPFAFTHNSWLSDDSQILFTTDERGDAPIGSYDISDLSNIQLLDEFRPSATINKGVIPHNVHVLDDYLIISHYTDGCVIVDAARPDNLVEVGNFDTFSGPDGGFGGSWGAYPFLPSGRVLVSDQSSGLFILEANYQRAAYLEGMVTDGSTEMGISGTRVQIMNTTTIELSRTTGVYKTGIATEGTYTVRVSKPGYETVDVEVELVSGEVTELDVVLQPLASFSFAGNVTDAVSGEVVADAQVKISNDDFSFSATTDAMGNFTLDQVFAGTYEVFAGRWGYKTVVLNNRALSETNNNISLALEVGIEDIFSLDLGWTTTFSGFSGAWELADPPIGVSAGPGFEITPSMDVVEDIGTGCYVTGNEPDLFSGVLIGGEATLTSPSFDLSDYSRPILSFHTWFLNVNGGDGSAPSTPDPIIIQVSNGTTTVNIDTITSILLGLETLEWQRHEYDLTDQIALTSDMQVTFAIDVPGGTDVVEAAVDYFQVVDAGTSSTTGANWLAYDVVIAPNPSTTNFQMQYTLPAEAQQAGVQVYNALGQLVEQLDLAAHTATISFGASYTPGVYWVQLTTAAGGTQAVRVVKE
ncbi:MAG: choice-of-anchor B family protein [Bacteroidota bacterium]